MTAADTTWGAPIAKGSDDHDAALELSDLLPPVEAAKFLRAELGYGLTEAMRLINRRRGIEIGERKA